MIKFLKGIVGILIVVPILGIIFLFAKLWKFLKAIGFLKSMYYVVVTIMITAASLTLAGFSPLWTGPATIGFIVLCTSLFTWKIAIPAYKVGK